MKKILSVIMMAVLFFSGCSEEDTDPVAMPRQASSLTIADAYKNFVVDKDLITKTIKPFSWTAADFGAAVVVNYSVQLDVKGGKFTEPKELLTTHALKPEIKAADLNSAILALGFKPEQTANVSVRVLASVENAPNILQTSGVVNITVVPYKRKLKTIYAVGSINGWDEEKGFEIQDVKQADVFEGYLNFPTSTVEIKFLKVKGSWAPQWGVSKDKEGGLTYRPTEGNPDPDPIKYSSDKPGVAYVTVNVPKLTYTIEQRNWGVVGKMSDWGNDTYFKYDPGTGLWTVTLDLKGNTGKENDGFKFRLNGNWDKGGYGTKDGKIADKEGGNIQVAEDGNYTITANFGLQDVEGYKANQFKIVKN
ncbi:MAG: SusE domain-containing protein [Cytophagales bacterium]|nr:SusE domain-containing protein [Cytophagales bacterium]